MVLVLLACLYSNVPLLWVGTWKQGVITLLLAIFTNCVKFVEHSLSPSIICGSKVITIKLNLAIPQHSSVAFLYVAPIYRIRKNFRG